MEINLSALSAIIADVDALKDALVDALAKSGPGGAKVTLAEWLGIIGKVGKLVTDVAKAAKN